MPITNAQPSSALPAGGMNFVHVQPMHVYLFKPGVGNWTVGPIGPDGNMAIIPKLITLPVDPGLLGQVTDPTNKKNPENVYRPAVNAYLSKGHLFIDPKDARTTVEPAHRGEKDGRSSPYAVAYDGTFKGADVRCYTHACAILEERPDGQVKISEVPWQFNRWALSLVERGVIPGPTEGELSMLLESAQTSLKSAQARAFKSPVDSRETVIELARNNLDIVQAAVERARKNAPAVRRKLPEPAATA